MPSNHYRRGCWPWTGGSLATTRQVGSYRVERYLISPIGGHSVRAYRLLSARRVDQQSVYASVTVDLNYDPKGKLRGEKIPHALRTEASFWKPPVGPQFDRVDAQLS